MIKAVLFDMDGVLFDSEKLYSKAVPEISAKLGYSMDRAFFVRTLGISSRECRRLYEEAYGSDYPFDKASDMLFQFILDYNQKHTMPMKAGVMECLSALRSLGLPLVVATSSPRFVADELFAALPELNRMFMGKVCGDEVAQGKPEPEIYQKAAALAGFPPAECLGVEDSPSGLMAIRASGAYAVMVPDLIPCTEALRPYVDSVLGGLGELPELIGRLNAN
jgi:HAD superfamily hydrolase (TIGR01509 family)